MAMNRRLIDEDSPAPRELPTAGRVSLSEAIAEMIDRWGEVLDRLGRA
jgi:hypothetical protein